MHKLKNTVDSQYGQVQSSKHLPMPPPSAEIWTLTSVIPVQLSNQYYLPELVIKLIHNIPKKEIKI